MKSAISYDNFSILDIRIGTVVACSAPEWSKKLLRFEVSFGEEIGTRVIFSGIKQWYTPDHFVGKQFPFLINLEPKKMGEEQSAGMMMMADAVDAEGNERPVLFHLPEPVADGTIVR